MDFKSKYLKYKQKYLKLQKTIKGGEIPCDITKNTVHGYPDILFDMFNICLQLRLL